jgi:hypothetical protein
MKNKIHPILYMHELRKRPLPALTPEATNQLQDEPMIGLNERSITFLGKDAKQINVSKNSISLHCPMTMANAALINRLYTDNEIMGIIGPEDFYRPLSHLHEPTGNIITENTYLGIMGSGKTSEESMEAFYSAVQKTLEEYPWKMYVDVDLHGERANVPFHLNWDHVSDKDDMLAISSPLNITFGGIAEELELNILKEFIGDLEWGDYNEVLGGFKVIPDPIIRACTYIFEDYPQYFE